MKKLYYINTENRHGQVLVFTSKRAAQNWARSATRWTDAEITENIKTAFNSSPWCNCWDIFTK